MEVEVGKIIGGKYRLTRLLGRGGMGQVWVARHKTLEQDVAIKLMTHMDVDEDLAEGAETALARFQLEAQVAASLSKRSRHIVAVTDHGYEQGSPYLVMDLLQGEGLDALLDRDRVLSVDRVVTIVAQTARGLSAAHAEGVVHRDLKPANVFLTRDEDGNPCVKIVDFGIAGLERRAGGSKTPKLTGLGIVLGSPHYMSPEQARGLSEIDRYVDLWALAVVAYEALTGVMPFDGKTPEDTIVRICMDTPKPITEVRPTLPRALDDFFARAFARNIADRFTSAEELAAAFTRAARADDARGSAPSFSDATPPVPPARGSAPSVPDEAAPPILPPTPAPTTVAPTVEETLPTPTPRAGTHRAIALGVVGVVALLAIVGLAWRVAHPPTEPSVAGTGASTIAATTTATTSVSEIPSAAPTITTTVTASAASSASATARLNPTPTVAPPTTGVRPSATSTAMTTASAPATTGTTGTIATVKPPASVDKGAIF